MNNMELTLVIFTVLGQASVGLAIMMALRQLSTAEGPEVPSLSTEWLVTGLVLLTALVVGLFHLGHPTGSPRALAHLSTSWLSREALAFMVFGALIIVALVVTLKKSSGSGVVMIIAALVGLAALFISGMVYSPPSFPALENGLPILFYVLTAFILGSAFSSYFVQESKKKLLYNILLVSLIVGLVVNLIVPSVWLSGGKVMQMTGSAYYGSGLYWLRLAGEFGLGIAVLAAIKKIPFWLPVILLAGELLGRIMFFTHVVNTAGNIGNIY
jgi:DMSO reductase anchor subunit